MNLPDDKAVILAAYLLISNCSFSSPTWSLTVIIYVKNIFSEP